MQGLNRIFLMGYLGSTPELYTSKNGHQFTGLNLATHRPQYAAADQESTSTTDWHYVRVWGKQAETCTRYLQKGQAVLVEGYLTQYAQVSETGETQRRTAVHAIRVDFLPRTTRTETENAGAS